MNEWNEWDGKTSSPKFKDGKTIVEVRCVNGQSLIGRIEEFVWKYFSETNDANIVAWRQIPQRAIAAADTINHPSHYNQGSIECIDAMEEATKNLKGAEAVCTSNIIRYTWRWKDKNGIEDLKKARWYLDRLIAKVEKDA